MLGIYALTSYRTILPSSQNKKYRSIPGPYINLNQQELSWFLFSCVGYIDFQMCEVIRADGYRA